MAEALAGLGIEIHEFQENVATCLSEGNFLLLIVGDRISPNIALLTQAIQSAPGLGFTLGLVEMQLYEAQAGSEWPLVVVPEVVGRTVERTRGVVRVRYTQEKPEVHVEVEDEGDGGPEPPTKLDLDLFLKEIPKDLVQPYREGVEEWKEAGNHTHFTNKVLMLETDVGGQRCRVVRCRSYQMTLIRREQVEKCCGDGRLYDGYLANLEASAVASQYARDDRHWISYKNLGADDLRVLLHAAVELARTMKSEG